MGLTTEIPTRKQIAVDLHILSLCLHNHYNPEDLERIAYQLAQFNAVADVNTNRSNSDHDF